MKYSTIGTFPDKISRIGLGTMTYGQQNTREEAFLQLDFGVDHGINFLDTAEMYPVPANSLTQGRTETYIGDWFQKHHKRKDVVLATKITGPGRHVGHVASDLRYASKRIRSALQNSLQRLKTDYIDIYQLHWPERPTNCFGKLGYPTETHADWSDNFNEVVHTLSLCKDEGLIRHWGLSNETPWGLMRAIQEGGNIHNFAPVTIQNPYNLVNRTFEIGLAEMALRENIGLLAYSPLAFGLLTGKYHDATATSSDRLNQFPQMARYSSPIVYSVAKEYIQLAREFNMSPAHLAIGYILSKPFTTSVLIGGTNLKQIEENIRSVDVVLPKELIEKVEAIHAKNSNPAP